MNHLHATQQDGAAPIVGSAGPERSEGTPLFRSGAPAALSVDDAFSPLELDFFKRAEELYASVFHTLEDFEPEAA